MDVLSVCMFAYFMCKVPIEAGKGHRIPRNWSCRLLWAAKGARIEHGFFGRASSSPDHWTILLLRIQNLVPWHLLSVSQECDSLRVSSTEQLKLQRRLDTLLGAEAVPGTCSSSAVVLYNFCSLPPPSFLFRISVTESTVFSEAFCLMSDSNVRRRSLGHANPSGTDCVFFFLAAVLEIFSHHASFLSLFPGDSSQLFSR